jgi:glycine/D-amino acid oxidase-like deaminating enzyme
MPVFLEHGEENPEFYPRPDSTLYICGSTSASRPLPPNPSDIKIVPEAITYLEELAEEMLENDWKQGAKVEKRQSCYLPVNTESGGLVLGFLKGVEGVIAACGHSVSCFGSSAIFSQMLTISLESFLGLGNYERPGYGSCRRRTHP